MIYESVLHIVLHPVVAYVADPNSSILQTGAVGGMLLLALSFVWYYVKQNNKRADAQIKQANDTTEHERAQVSKLENALNEQNKIIIDKIVPTAHSLSESLSVIPPLVEKMINVIESRED